MSPAITLVKPFAKPVRPCPYCDHISPADSKFCSACGAALHLVPCPHCGAVNDITKTTSCYRCHGELHESTAAPAPATTIEPEPVTEAAELVGKEPRRHSRPHGLVVLIVLLAFAAASYYAFRQRGSLEVREPTPANAEVKGRVNPVGAASSPAAAPVAAEKTVAPETRVMPAADTQNARPETGVNIVPAEVTAPVGSRINANKSAVARDSTTTVVAPAAPAPAPAPENLRARSDAGKGLQQPSPNIGPCTEAVAALGLCSPEPAQKR